MNDMEWPERITHTIVTRIGERRTALGMSYQDLANACTELGYPTIRTTLANLEGGRRKSITVHELFIVAKALEVSPIELISDVTETDTVEVLPNEQMSGPAAQAWITGTDATQRSYKAGVRAAIDAAMNLI